MASPDRSATGIGTTEQLHPLPGVSIGCLTPGATVLEVFTHEADPPADADDFLSPALADQTA